MMVISFMDVLLAGSKHIRTLAHLMPSGGVHSIGYAGFERLIAPGGIVLVSCWAHARRKFSDLHEATGSPIGAEACGGSPNSMRSMVQSGAERERNVGMCATPAPAHSSR